MLARDSGGGGGGNLGIHVPEGDPAQLESGANALRTMAFALDHVGGRLQAAGQVPGWTGVASFTFANTATTDVRGVRRGVDAMLAGARIVDRLAHDLHEVKRATKAAVSSAHAADAQRRSAQSAAQEARDEAIRQRIIAEGAQLRITQRQLTGDPAPADVAAYRLADAAAARAYQEAALFDGDRQRALNDLADARAAGQRANDHYQRLARAAASAIEGLAVDTPTMVNPSVAVGRRGGGGVPDMLPAFAPGLGFRSGEREEGEEEQEPDPLIAWPAQVSTKSVDAMDGAERAASTAAERMLKVLAASEEAAALAASEEAASIAAQAGSAAGTGAERAAKLLAASQHAARVESAAGTAKALSRVAKPLGPLAPAITLVANKAEGQDWKTAAARTTVTTAGAVLGGAAAGAACGSVTFGIAAGVCGAAGSVGGGFVGEKLGAVIFGE
jgi:hypothetical protein